MERPKFQVLWGYVNDDGKHHVVTMGSLYKPTTAEKVAALTAELEESTGMRWVMTDKPKE